MIQGKTHRLSPGRTKFQQAFWCCPNRLQALRATASMGLVSVPFIIAGLPFYGVTLALGALAGALTETHDHPKGRAKAILITVLAFFVSSFAVGLLNKDPWLLGTGFILSTILFILIGGISEQYRTITFGSILVGIYAMLGIEISPAWYWQAVLLPAGALFHGIITLTLTSINPWRLLDEQLAGGYKALAQYLDAKAKLFPSKKQEQATINKDLALRNISVVNTLEKIREVLNNYGRELKDQEVLRPYLQRFMLLQSLHERAASSHERHDKLSHEEEQAEVMEGFGEILRQLAYACRQVAENMLTGRDYEHPPALEWISKAVEDKLPGLDPDSAQPFVLLHHNLNRSHLSLKFLDNWEQGTAIPRLKKDERSLLERFRLQLSFSNPRMRYALRLSLSFLIGFVLERSLHMEKGTWVMLTSLFVSQVTYSDTRRRLFQRVLGTATGVILGALLLHIFIGTSAQVLLMLGSSVAFFYWLRTNYSVAVIFITTFVISAFNLIAPDAGIHIMIPRLIDTLLGAALSFLSIRFLWPGWQYLRMPELISIAMKKNRNYLQAIISEYKETSVDDLAYRIARREAHLADNELAQAWNSMRQEPRSKQMLMQHAFTLTFLNHALLSHISALGAHRETHMFINVSDLTEPMNKVLKDVGNYLMDPEQDVSTDLSPLLLQLKEQINATNTLLEKQQLRLVYNVANGASRIMRELQEMAKDSNNGTLR